MGSGQNEDEKAYITDVENQMTGERGFQHRLSEWQRHQLWNCILCFASRRKRQQLHSFHMSNPVDVRKHGGRRKDVLSLCFDSQQIVSLPQPKLSVDSFRPFVLIGTIHFTQNQRRFIQNIVHYPLPVTGPTQARSINYTGKAFNCSKVLVLSPTFTEYFVDDYRRSHVCRTMYD